MLGIVHNFDEGCFCLHGSNTRGSNVRKVLVSVNSTKPINTKKGKNKTSELRKRNKTKTNQKRQSLKILTSHRKRVVSIPSVSQHKHFGIRLNGTLIWKDHISRTRTKCAQRVGMLRRMSKILSVSTETRLYKAVVRPMENGCQIWSGVNTSSLQRIQDRFCCTHGVYYLPNGKSPFDYPACTVCQNSKWPSSQMPPISRSQ